ncbi:MULTISPECIES: RDD family protein [unclassified Amycolatopsis]|uniref:RDD family protein n=1 Tax=unclassified Amycolatopsis TaxID=2618356 RepID=UPI0028765E23|nr:MULTISPECIES: RDD family protein [unclassified Amycolatopsis]MDS0134582.1 RDD family protein [Amycolatopsis sp. 505]MDS0147519.1 RDD family protein [Amycolatopsis sp. CM201R]
MTSTGGRDSPGELPERLRMAGRRVVQAVLDQALATGVGVFAALAAGLVAIPLLRWGWVPPKVILWGPVITFFAVNYACDAVIQIWIPLRRGGVTPGMLVMGLRVETLRGGPPKARAYVIRWLLMTVDGLLLGLVAVVSIAVSRRRQRIGDLVARTLVVRAGPRTFG